MTQLPKLFGVPGGSGDFFERLWKLGSQLPDTQPVVLAFGICAIALLIIGDKLFPARPIALFVVAASIVALSATPLAQMGFKTVGVLPAGLPDFMLPSLQARDIDGIVPLALACFLLAYIEGISSARALAQKHGDEIDPRQELFALGAANLAAAVCQGYPVAGGLSQSTVNDKAGAKTPLSVVLASVTIALCLLFLTGLLRNLPDVVLAAIVLVAVKGLINIPELRRVWTLSRTEFLIAVAAIAGVLLLGILKGVLLAAAFSIALLVNRAARPHVARLARIPRTQRYSDVDRNPENENVPVYDRSRRIGIALFQRRPRARPGAGDTSRCNATCELSSGTCRPRLMWTSRERSCCRTQHELARTGRCVPYRRSALSGARPLRKAIRARPGRDKPQGVGFMTP